MLQTKGKNMKEKLIILASAILLLGGTSITKAQPVPCPDCPPCTNCPPYTNNFTPVEFPTNALLIRQAQILDGSTVIYNGPNWVLDTNNLLIASGGDWTTNPPTDNVWTYVLGVTNSTSNLLYSLEYRSSLAVPGTNVGNYFVGSATGAELLLTNTVVNADPQGFWLLHQQPGFVAWSKARNKPQGMGIIENLQCPGIWSGYIDFTNGPVGGQYRVDTNAMWHSYTDFLRTTNPIEAWGGPYFDCDHGVNTLGNTTPATAYTSWCRVFIPMPNDWPTNQNYPIWLQGFVSP
jgi:hypothetical protein